MKVYKRVGVHHDLQLLVNVDLSWMMNSQCTHQNAVIIGRGVQRAGVVGIIMRAPQCLCLCGAAGIAQELILMGRGVERVRIVGELSVDQP